MSPHANLLVMQTCMAYKGCMSALRTRRKELGLTLAQLAAKVGVSEGQLSRIERDGTSSLDRALKVARETGVPVEELIRKPASDDRSAAA